MSNKSPYFSATCNLNILRNRGALCLSSFLILNRGLLQILGNVSSSVVLLSELGGGRRGAVDSLVLLRRLTCSVGGAVGGVLFGFEACDLLLGLLDVLQTCQ